MQNALVYESCDGCDGSKCVSSQHEMTCCMLATNYFHSILALQVLQVSAFTVSISCVGQLLPVYVLTIVGCTHHSLQQPEE
jgi:hypothetical protein